jgi:ribosomal protein S18 acetylase RimI-like enzyme
MPSTDLILTFRSEPRPQDIDAVRDITASTEFFSPDEIDVAVELIEDRLERGVASEYHFLFADDEAGRTFGFACFGRIACTLHSFDLYWIAVHNDQRGCGAGTRLLQEAERLIAAEGGGRIYVETSSREQYAPTRRFYLKSGYRVDAVQDDFYAPGDGKVVLVKML